jgi:hypothetical protein
MASVFDRVRRARGVSHGSRRWPWAYGLRSAPSGAAEAGYEPIVFELVKGSGLDFVVEPSRTDKCHQPETMISGSALFDYDGDGRSTSTC